MTSELPPRRPRPRRRRTWPWLLILRLVVLAAVFALGVALGAALHDNPRPGPAVTRERTLEPVQLAPAEKTVTVTISRGSG